MYLVVHVLHFCKQSLNIVKPSHTHTHILDSLINNLFEIETFCSIINTFIMTFDQLNASYKCNNKICIFIIEYILIII